jgi:hypothetical protein
MISGEDLFSDLLTIGILLGLLIIVYSKMSEKTLGDMIRDIREAFSDNTEEIYQHVPTSFEDIR